MTQSAIETTVARPSRSAGREALSVACAAMFVSYLPFSAVNGAPGQIAAATGATTADLEWASGAFALALASIVLATGTLGDLYGRRRIAAIGLSCTVRGALLSALGIVLPGGRVLVALSVGQAKAGPFASRMQRRFAPRVPLLAGLVIGAVGLACLSGVTASSSLLDIGWRLAMTGFGCGLVMSIASAVAISAVAGPFAGMAGAANNALRQIGAALGTAILGTILAAYPASTVGLSDAVHVSALITMTLLGLAAVSCGILLRIRNTVASLTTKTSLKGTHA